MLQRGVRLNPRTDTTAKRDASKLRFVAAEAHVQPSGRRRPHVANPAESEGKPPAFGCSLAPDLFPTAGTEVRPFSVQEDLLIEFDNGPTFRVVRQGFRCSPDDP